MIPSRPRSHAIIQITATSQRIDFIEVAFDDYPCNVAYLLNNRVRMCKKYGHKPSGQRAGNLMIYQKKPKKTPGCYTGGWPETFNAPQVSTIRVLVRRFQKTPKAARIREMITAPSTSTSSTTITVRKPFRNRVPTDI